MQEDACQVGLVYFTRPFATTHKINMLKAHQVFWNNGSVKIRVCHWALGCNLGKLSQLYSKRRRSSLVRLKICPSVASIGGSYFRSQHHIEGHQGCMGGMLFEASANLQAALCLSQAFNLSKSLKWWQVEFMSATTNICLSQINTSLWHMTIIG